MARITLNDILQDETLVPSEDADGVKLASEERGRRVVEVDAVEARHENGFNANAVHPMGETARITMQSILDQDNTEVELLNDKTYGYNRLGAKIHPADGTNYADGLIDSGMGSPTKWSTNEQKDNEMTGVFSRALGGEPTKGYEFADTVRGIAEDNLLRWNPAEDGRLTFSGSPMVKKGSTLSKAWSRGVDNLKVSGGGLMSYLGEAIDNPELRAAGDAYAADATLDANLNPQKIRDFSHALQNTGNFIDYVTEAVGENLPALIPDIVAAVTTGGLGAVVTSSVRKGLLKAAVNKYGIEKVRNQVVKYAAGTGGALSMGSQSTGTFANELHVSGIEDRGLTPIWVGAGVAAVNILPEMMIFGRAAKAAGLSDAIARGLATRASDVAKTMGIGAGTEFIASPASMYIEDSARIAHNLLKDDKRDIDAYIEGTIKGMIGGAGIGGAISTVANTAGAVKDQYAMGQDQAADELGRTPEQMYDTNDAPFTELGGKHVEGGKYKDVKGESMDGRFKGMKGESMTGTEYAPDATRPVSSGKGYENTHPTAKPVVDSTKTTMFEDRPDMLGQSHTATISGGTDATTSFAYNPEASPQTNYSNFQQAKQQEAGFDYNAELDGVYNDDFDLDQDQADANNMHDQARFEDEANELDRQPEKSSSTGPIADGRPTPRRYEDSEAQTILGDDPGGLGGFLDMGINSFSDEFSQDGLDKKSAEQASGAHQSGKLKNQIEANEVDKDTQAEQDQAAAAYAKRTDKTGKKLPDDGTGGVLDPRPRITMDMVDPDLQSEMDHQAETNANGRTVKKVLTRKGDTNRAAKKSAENQEKLGGEWGKGEPATKTQRRSKVATENRRKRKSKQENSDLVGTVNKGKPVDESLRKYQLNDVVVPEESDTPSAYEKQTKLQTEQQTARFNSKEAVANRAAAKTKADAKVKADKATARKSLTSAEKIKKEKAFKIQKIQGITKQSQPQTSILKGEKVNIVGMNMTRILPVKDKLQSNHLIEENVYTHKAIDGKLSDARHKEIRDLIHGEDGKLLKTSAILHLIRSGVISAKELGMYAQGVGIDLTANVQRGKGIVNLDAAQNKATLEAMHRRIGDYANMHQDFLRTWAKITADTTLSEGQKVEKAINTSGNKIPRADILKPMHAAVLIERMRTMDEKSHIGELDTPESIAAGKDSTKERRTKTEGAEATARVEAYEREQLVRLEEQTESNATKKTASNLVQAKFNALYQAATPAFKKVLSQLRRSAQPTEITTVVKVETKPLTNAQQMAKYQKNAERRKLLSKEAADRVEQQEAQNAGTKKVVTEKPAQISQATFNARVELLYEKLPLNKKLRFDDEVAPQDVPAQVVPTYGFDKNQEFLATPDSPTAYVAPFQPSNAKNDPVPNKNPRTNTDIAADQASAEGAFSEKPNVETKQTIKQQQEDGEYKENMDVLTETDRLTALVDASALGFLTKEERAQTVAMELGRAIGTIIGLTNPKYFGRGQRALKLSPDYDTQMEAVIASMNYDKGTEHLARLMYEDVIGDNRAIDIVMTDIRFKSQADLLRKLLVGSKGEITPGILNMLRSIDVSKVETARSKGASIVKHAHSVTKLLPDASESSATMASLRRVQKQPTDFPQGTITVTTPDGDMKLSAFRILDQYLRRIGIDPEGVPKQDVFMHYQAAIAHLRHTAVENGVPITFYRAFTDGTLIYVNATKRNESMTYAHARRTFEGRTSKQEFGRGKEKSTKMKDIETALGRLAKLGDETDQWGDTVASIRHINEAVLHAVKNIKSLLDAGVDFVDMAQFDQAVDDYFAEGNVIADLAKQRKKALTEAKLAEKDALNEAKTREKFEDEKKEAAAADKEAKNLKTLHKAVEQATKDFRDVESVDTDGSLLGNADVKDAFYAAIDSDFEDVRDFDNESEANIDYGRKWNPKPHQSALNPMPTTNIVMHAQPVVITMKASVEVVAQDGTSKGKQLVHQYKHALATVHKAVEDGTPFYAEVALDNFYGRAIQVGKYRLDTGLMKASKQMRRGSGELQAKRFNRLNKNIARDLAAPIISRLAVVAPKLAKLIHDSASGGYLRNVENRRRAFYSSISELLGDAKRIDVAMQVLADGGAESADSKELSKFLNKFNGYVLKHNPEANITHAPIILNTEMLNDRKAEVLQILRMGGSTDVEAEFSELLGARGAQDFALEVSPHALPGARRGSRSIQGHPLVLQAFREGGFIKKDNQTVLIQYIAAGIRNAEWHRLMSRTDGKTFKENSEFQKLTRHIVAGSAESIELHKLMQGMMGQLHQDIPRGWRLFNSVAIGFNNLRLLAFSGVSSIPEVGLVLARTHSIKFAAANLGGFAKRLMTTKGRTELTKFARELGMMEHIVNKQNLTELYGSGELSVNATMQRGTDWMFRLNGQYAVTNFTRKMSAFMGKNFIYDHADKAKKGNAMSKKHLVALNITVAQVDAYRAYENENGATGYQIFDKDVGAITTPMGDAVNLFSQQSVLTPNAAQLPLYATDARFAVVGHFKNFFYAMYDAFYKGIIGGEFGRQHENKNAMMAIMSMGPTVVMSAMIMVGLGAFQDLIRNGIKGNGLTMTGEEDEWMMKAFSQSGLLGPATIIESAYESAGWGRNGVASVLGPTADYIFNELLGDSKGRQIFTNSVPLVSQNVAGLKKPAGKLYDKFLSSDSYE